MTHTADLAEGRRRRDEGIARATHYRHAAVLIYRICAISIARERGTVTADDVRRKMDGEGHGLELGPAWGSLFKCKDFEPTGEWRQSTVPSNHGRAQRVWRLR